MLIVTQSYRMKRKSPVGGNKKRKQQPAMAQPELPNKPISSSPQPGLPPTPGSQPPVADYATPFDYKLPPSKKPKKYLLIGLAALVVVVGLAVNWLDQRSSNTSAYAPVANSSVFHAITASQQQSTIDLRNVDPMIGDLQEAINDQSAPLNSTTVSGLKAQAKTEVDRRMGVYTRLLARLNASTTLSQQDLQAMSAQITDQQANLPKLLDKINSETSMTQLQADVQAIRTDYRVYRLIRPKATMLITADQLNVTANSLEATADKLEAAIKTAQSQGKDVKLLLVELAQMRALISSASSATGGVSDSLRPLTPADWNADHKVLVGLLVSLAKADTGLRSASQKGADIAAKLKGLHFNPQPNIILVLTDDESLNLMQFMPNTNQLIGDQGAVFNNYFDNISLCCAARTSIMRGQYAHNSHVEDNSYPGGGFEQFYKLGEQNDNIATWMHDAGYDTSLMGKYLNQYPGNKNGSYPQYAVPPTWIPPGWGDWFVPITGAGYKEFDYQVNDNGVIKQYGHAPKDYLVDVESARAVKYIKNHQHSSKPYFMYIATYAPHAPYTPPPRYAGTQKSLTYPQTPAFNEADVSDKPSFIASRPLLDNKQQKKITEIYQKRAEAVRGVDDLVKNVYDTLKSTGQLDNTYLVFTTDNAYHMGEHRLDPGKDTPYETDIHLPLYVRGPGIKPGTKVPEMAGNIDLAPTFATLAGARIAPFVDGQSLVPYLFGGHRSSGDRKYYLLERDPSQYVGVEWSQLGTTNEEAQDQVLPGHTTAPAPPFHGVRSSDGYVYATYSDGQAEFYDLHTDPFELHNLLAHSSSGQKLTSGQTAALNNLKTALAGLVACQTTSCITASQ